MIRDIGVVVVVQALGRVVVLVDQIVERVLVMVAVVRGGFVVVVRVGFVVVVHGGFVGAGGVVCGGFVGAGGVVVWLRLRLSARTLSMYRWTYGLCFVAVLLSRSVNRLRKLEM